MPATDTTSIENQVFDDLHDTQDTTSIIVSRLGPGGELQRAPLYIDQCIASVDRLISPLFDSTQRQISEFEKLERNWDSYGAEPIEEESIHAALKLLSRLPAELAAEIGENMVPTAAVPVPDGGVQLEWILPKFEVEVEFGADGSISCLLVLGESHDRRFAEIDNLTSESIVALLTKLFRAR